MQRLTLIIALILCVSTINLLQAQEIKPAEVKQIMKKVADWQIEHVNDLYSGRKRAHHPLDWTKGIKVGRESISNPQGSNKNIEEINF